MKIHTYLSSSGKDLIMEYINALTIEEQVDGLAVLAYMEKGEFEKVLSKRWDKKVYEVYFRRNNRIFYVTADRDNIYLLHVCRKQKNKTERVDKNIVLARTRELGRFLGRKIVSEEVIWHLQKLIFKK